MTQISQYFVFRKKLLVGTIHLVTSVINVVFYGRKFKVGVWCEENFLRSVSYDIIVSYD